MLGTIYPEIIYIFFGKMGSGKTTNAVKQILDFRSKGKTVWVNFPIKELPVWKSKKVEEPKVYYEDDPEGILCMRDGLYVIDEAYLYLNSRDWQNLSKKVFTAFTHVRKIKYQISDQGIYLRAGERNINNFVAFVVASTVKLVNPNSVQSGNNEPTIEITKSGI